MAKISIKNALGNASELEFNRGGNANWLLTSDKGYLRFQSDWNGTKGSYEDVLVLSEATTGDATFKGSINASKNIFASYPTNGEADVGVRYNGGALYFWGNSGGTRGIWDDNFGRVMAVTNTSASFSGSATSLAYGATLKTNDEINNGIIANTFSVNLWNENSFPGASNGILLNMGYTTTTYGAQIAIDDDPTYKIFLRQKNGDGWSSWKQIPMGDGTGASGTWGISVSGGA